MRPPLPHSPMTLWPSTSQQPQLGGMMPPLPPGPPPNSNNNRYHLDHGLLLNPMMGRMVTPPAAPPLSSGPRPGQNHAHFAQMALCQLVSDKNNGGLSTTASHLGGSSALGGSRSGPLDCPPAILQTPSAMALPANQPLPGALLPGVGSTPGPFVSLPATLAPPLPLVSLGAPAARTFFAAAMPPSSTTAMDYIANPTVNPPFPIPTAIALPAADLSTPAGGAGGASGAVSPIQVSDEFACFAMKCAVADIDSRPSGNAFHPSELWSPLQFNDQSGRLEATSRGWPLESALENEMIHSPLEPGLSKREVSFSTQMVRRAVSFIFSDAIDDRCSSPLKSENRQRAHSPHTAVAA